MNLFTLLCGVSSVHWSSKFKRENRKMGEDPEEGHQGDEKVGELGTWRNVEGIGFVQPTLITKMLGTVKNQWAQAASGEILSRLTKYSSLWHQLNIGMGYPASIKRIEIPNVNWARNRHQCFISLETKHESGVMCEWLVVLLRKNTTVLVLSVILKYSSYLKTYLGPNFTFTAWQEGRYIWNEADPDLLLEFLSFW